MASLHFQEWPTSADGGDDSEWYEWNEAALMVLHIRLYICEDSHACFRRIGRTHLGASTRLYMMLLLLPVVSLFSDGFSKHCLLSGHISRRRYLTSNAISIQFKSHHFFLARNFGNLIIQRLTYMVRRLCCKVLPLSHPK